MGLQVGRIFQRKAQHVWERYWMNENEEKCAENENKQIRKKEERELPQTKYNKKRRAS